MSNYYEFLQVENTATTDEIIVAIKDQISKLKNPRISSSLRNEEFWQTLWEAAWTLPNDQNRNNYDSFLGKMNWDNTPSEATTAFEKEYGECKEEAGKKIIRMEQDINIFLGEKKSRLLDCLSCLWSKKGYTPLDAAPEQLDSRYDKRPS
ncbi:MAG: hypothetical protein ACD_60C00045G0005 [uncultured bacterium]|nr:MAG: hypothetical protein ACD_60C00045G0005 [uncultured bacterium]